MSAVLLAIFNEHKIAERVRLELVHDGFPTDRVELTAGCEPGRAGLGPADSPHGRFVQYFRVLFTFEDERHYAEQLAVGPSPTGPDAAPTGGLRRGLSGWRRCRRVVRDSLQ